MLWSIDACHNKVSADQYHVIHHIMRSSLVSLRSQVFLKLTADQVLAFDLSQARVHNLKLIEV